MFLVWLLAFILHCALLGMCRELRRALGLGCAAAPAVRQGRGIACDAVLAPPRRPPLAAASASLRVPPSLPPHPAVYTIMQIADLEADYLNPHDAAASINRLVVRGEGAVRSGSGRGWGTAAGLGDIMGVLAKRDEVAAW